MELVSLDHNSAPPGAILGMVWAADGTNLRFARWPCPDACRGTVTILTGRAEFIEKYFETIGELLARNFEVVIMDWRGQGLSDRPLKHRGKGHVDDFATYASDLAALEKQVLRNFCPKPWFALGHSMAGAVLLAEARAGHSPFARIVLTAPMIDLHGLRFPRGARGLARGLVWLGLGRAFMPGGSSKPVMTKSFESNVLTSDAARYARTAKILELAPQLAIGDPTIRWVHAAFRIMRQFRDPEYAPRTVTPILILAAGADEVVDTSATERFASRLKAGRCIILPHARHELLMERDSIRTQFWAAFDAFVPGSAPGDTHPANKATRDAGRNLAHLANP